VALCALVHTSEYVNAAVVMMMIVSSTGFRGSVSALLVYINHLSGYALFSSYTLKVSIFYYQKVMVEDSMWTWRPTLVFYPKKGSRVPHVFSCQNFETFFTTQKRIAYEIDVLWFSVSVQNYTIIRETSSKRPSG